MVQIVTCFLYYSESYIKQWVGAVSTGDGFGHLREETAPLKSHLMALYKSVDKKIVSELGPAVSL